MSNENENNYRVAHVEISGFGKLEMRQLDGNDRASTFCLDSSNLRDLDINFWLRLHSALNDQLSLKVITILNFPGRLGADLKEVFLVLHEPRNLRYTQRRDPEEI